MSKINVTKTEIRGITPDAVNIITDLLRDRYANGFPILKELIQNADDASARQLIFAMDPGFPDSRHPLLQGPGLWFFNDGKFQSSDAENLRFVGIGNKAGDSATIGKFGLGMKSVFHLCEALFYVAWDGTDLYHEMLTPWKRHGQDLDRMWGGPIIDADDWNRLRKLASGLLGSDDENRTWFLLWLPLRMEEHLQTKAGKTTGAIINYFPGDEPAGELEFLYDADLVRDLADMLPLLRRLKRLEHKGKHNRFVLQLSDAPRLIGEGSLERIGGKVMSAGRRQLLAFSGGRTESPDADGVFADMKARKEWPPVRYRDELGHEHSKPDPASAKGAVLFCSGRRGETRSRLQWAVFLPVEDGGEPLVSGSMERGHSLVLHGQFFVDAGRKKIHDHEHLHEEPASLGESPIDVNLLRRMWNQRLAQDIVLPLVLPTLEDHVLRHGLSEADCRGLTEAMSESKWFKNFRTHICRAGVWVRTLEGSTKPRWRVVEGKDRSRLRPLPKPPGTDPERPWKVFPQLAACDVMPYDAEAPRLSDKLGDWQREELEMLLSQLDGLFVVPPSMDYVINFLDNFAGPYLDTEQVQHRFRQALRDGLQAAGPEDRVGVAAKASGLVNFLQQERWLELKAKLPEPVLKELWAIDAPVLLVPRGMKPKGLEPESPVTASVGESDLAAWLEVLDRALDSSDDEEEHKSILQVVQGLLRTLSAEDRRRFLKKHRTLRVVRVWDVRNRIDRPVSVQYLNRVRTRGCLFTFAEGLREDRLGIAPLLARAIPDADVCLVRADTYRELFSEDESQGEATRIPRASEGRACLSAVGRYPGPLGDIDDRRHLLDRANDPGTDKDACRGLRFLLHGSPDKRNNIGAKLWIGRHGQHAAWHRLWAVMHEADEWSLLKEDVVETIPRKRWHDANIAEIDPETLIDELRDSGLGFGALEGFSPDEREEILSHMDARDTIEIALGALEPVHYWRDVMNALHRLQTPVDEDLRRLIRSTAWLPTTCAGPVKPKDVIDLRGSLSGEVPELVTEHRKAHGPCFAVPKELDDAVQNHGASGWLHEVGFSSGKAGLRRLGRVLEKLPDYHIGEWPKRLPADAIGLLARYDGLPGWRLLEAAAADPFHPDTAWEQLGQALSRAVEPHRLAAVLDWLSSDNHDWQIRKSAHDNYLRQLTEHEQSVREHLLSLRLASADKHWRKAAKLCAGAHGVVRRSLLDPEQEAILGDLVCRAGSSRTGDQPGTPQDDFQQAQSDAPGLLRKYFRAWDGFVQHPIMIGVVLALLGRHVRELADHYLDSSSFSWLAGQLRWYDPHRIEWLDVECIYQALESIQVAVRVEKEDEVRVRNLLGDPIPVARDECPDTLLAGPLEWQGGAAVMLPLRHIEPDRFPPEQLSKLLQTTAEQLSIDLYNQRAAIPWQELAKSDQLELGIARQLIVDHMPFYLRQLSITGKPIQKLLKNYDKRRRRVLEAAGEGENLLIKSTNTNLRQVRNKIAKRIARNPDVRQAVLRAVKSKIAQYQYAPSSIPLELFQNADDAAVELGQCRAHPSDGCEVPTPAQHFVVEEREDGLGFLHWGRPINDRGPAGFDGEDRGYDRDMEKMLILSATDKHRDEGTTGKFGLGFKSVLLACDQPRILSGNLAFCVVAGFLPQPWENADDARQRLLAFGTDQEQGTLIDLPGVNGKVRAEVLERFLSLAGVLCVFGRAIRSVRHVGASESSWWSWKPDEICTGIEVGKLHMQGNWGDGTRALCVRASDGSLLMALGPEGFRPLPDTVPALWVTAPTMKSSAIGFAVNGSFDLDVGRGQLTGDTSKNVNKAKRIGQQVGDALGALLERSHDEKDWNSVRPTLLEPEADLDALGFWESIWFGLAKGWLDGDDLTQEIALGALAQLCECPRAIPNGLKGSLRRFADAGEIRYELSGMMLREDVGEELDTWKCFRSRYSARECVSEEIGRILREVRSDAKLGSPQFLESIGLSELVELLDRSRVEPADAEVLGRLRLLTPESEDWERDDLPERLRGLLFRSAAGEWIEARKLLAVHGPLDRDGRLDPDEPRRHELAPCQFRLDADYYAKRGDERPALAFFWVCRRRMETPTRMLEQWVLDAESDAERFAALVYLADGDLGERIADEVRGRGWLKTALEDPRTKRLTEEQQDRLRRRLHLVPVPPPPPPPHHTLAAALEDIYGWWSREGHERAVKHRERLYPSRGFHGQDLMWDPDTGQNDSSSWFTLLALGSFQSMGRTQKEQHRGFIQLCQNKGWWKIFTDSDPKQERDRWMEIIEKYAESRHGDEEWINWLSQFPRLYVLRRWLDDYVTIFRSIDQITEPFTQNKILAPLTNPQLQGSGIDAPPLTRTLKVGFHLIVRELLHHGVIKNPLAIPHAYAPITRVKNFFSKFHVHVDTSEGIHRVLKERLGEEEATFGGDYDIPLRIRSRNDWSSRQMTNIWQ